MGAIIERTISIKGEPGFPTGIYFKTIGILKAFGFTVKKYKDWIEINPRSDLYQEIIRKKQVIEQSVGRILSNISDMRRDIELIKHDLRKFEQVLDHFDQNKLDSLKSDFVDLVDSQTPSGMHKLVASGKFPTLVIDFFKIKSEEDIDKLKVSESEKGILKTKWMLFEEWLEKYSKAVRERVEMLREESKKISFEPPPVKPLHEYPPRTIEPASINIQKPMERDISREILNRLEAIERRLSRIEQTIRIPTEDNQRY